MIHNEVCRTFGGRGMGMNITVQTQDARGTHERPTAAREVEASQSTRVGRGALHADVLPAVVRCDMVLHRVFRARCL